MVKGEKKIKQYLWHDGIAWPQYWGLVTRHSPHFTSNLRNKKIKLIKHTSGRQPGTWPWFSTKTAVVWGLNGKHVSFFKAQNQDDLSKSKPLPISCRHTCWMVCVCWLISLSLQEESSQISAKSTAFYFTLSIKVHGPVSLIHSNTERHCGCMYTHLKR